MKILLMLILMAASMNLSGQTSGISWQKTYGGPNKEDPRSIRQVDDGYLICGATRSSTGDVSMTYGSADVWLVKVSLTGNMVWEQSYGGSSLDIAHSMNLTSDGGCIIGGYTTTPDLEGTNFNGWTDAYAIKVDSNGVVQWQKTFGSPGPEQMFDIQQTSDGGYIFCGFTDSTGGDVSFYHGGIGADVWVVKLNDSGVIQWEKSIGGTNSEIGYSLLQTTDGGYMVAGFTGSADGDVSAYKGSTDGWMIKLSSAGAIQWEKTFSDTNSQIFWSIQQTSDGGFIAAGATGAPLLQDDFFVVKTDSNGAVEWIKSYGGSATDFAYTVQQSVDGGFVVGGRTYSADGDISLNHSSFDDAWIIKLDSSGYLQWEKTYGGTNKEAAFSIIQAKDSNFIFCSPSNSTDGDLLNNQGQEDIWVVKLGPVINSVSPSADETNQVQVYPTITSGMLTVALPTTKNVSQLSMYNSSGMLVLTQTLSKPHSHVDLTNYATGFYFVEVRERGQRSIFRIFIK